MKTIRLILAILALLPSVFLFAQETINFQGVLRSAEGDILANANIDLRVIIYPSGEDPMTADFTEEHLGLNTNDFGVFSAYVGDLSALDQLDFSNQEYLVEISLRTEGAQDYQVLSTEKFSVSPYAQHAKTVENADDADADPSNEMQSLTRDGNMIVLSDGGTVIDEVEDGDSDPTNDMQSLDFDASTNTLSISEGNEVTLPMAGGADDDPDPENELQFLSLLGNGDLTLSKGGGRVPLQQSPLINTTDEDGEFAYQLRQKLGIGNNTPSGEAMLDVQGPAKASLYFLNERVKLLPAGSGFRSFRIENDQEILAEFDASAGNERATLKINQVRIGDVKISNRFVGSEDEIYMHIAGSSDRQLLRLGPEISAINSTRLFLSNVSMLHGSSSSGDLGLQLFNSGGNGNSWNMYVANGNGNLEFYHKGNIKARVRSSDGEWVVNSDRRFKKDISKISSVLSQLLLLQPKTYRYKNADSNKKSLGFIAQEVEVLFPQLVHRDSDSKDFYGINYSGFSVLAIKAIQELAEMVEQEKEKNEALEMRLNRIEKQLAERSK